MMGKGAMMLAKHLDMMDEGEDYKDEKEGEEAGEMELKVKFKTAAELRAFMMKGCGGKVRAAGCQG